MSPLIMAHDRETVAARPEAGLPPAPDPAGLTCQPPDARAIETASDGSAAGRCSLWWRQAPPLPGDRVGIIGHYAAQDAEAGRRLLQQACTHLAEEGCTLALGPMDGSTWRRYRLVTDQGSEPPFFLEPDHPPEWLRHFLGAGFRRWTGYVSTVVEDLALQDARLDQSWRRLAAAGIRIRSLDPTRAEQDLRGIYRVAVTSFAGSLLYTPLAEAEFLSLYRPLLAHVRPELILLAEDAAGPVGFVFGVPDLLQARRGVPVDTVIVKTLAVLPGRRAAGLGSLLVGQCHQAARQLGLTRAIHALMHEGNVSRNIYGEHARPIRRYALFARRLRGPA